MDGPYRTAPGDSGLTCPRCPGVRLSRRVIGYVALEDCGRCGGSLATARALDAICGDLALYEPVRAAYPIAPPGAPHGPMYIRCPECGDLMNRRLFADRARVVLDVCRLHGSWLDRGELRAIVDFVETNGYLEERQRETARRFEEKRAAEQAVAAMTRPRAERRRGPIAQAIVDLLTFWV